MCRGVVKDLDAIYAEASATIIPLQIGSGLKVKLVEAPVHVQTIMTTSIGAQVLMDFSWRSFLVADSDAGFTMETVALLGSPVQQTALRGEAARCARAFAPQAVFSELDAAISSDLMPV